ncbi:MAG: P-II family nitrogen regulator [Christensenella sp.]|nr:P-II family nitrogen regulator [Christensenella sp.]
MDQSLKIKALFIIVNAGYADAIMELVRAEGASGATILNARGEGARHESFLGITVDSEKEIIMTIVDAETAKRITATMKEKAGWKSTLRGICFTMPVDRVVGINTTTLEKLEKSVQ